MTQEKGVDPLLPPEIINSTAVGEVEGAESMTTPVPVISAICDNEFPTTMPVKTYSPPTTTTEDLSAANTTVLAPLAPASTAVTGMTSSTSSATVMAAVNPDTVKVVVPVSSATVTVGNAAGAHKVPSPLVSAVAVSATVANTYVADGDKYANAMDAVSIHG